MKPSINIFSYATGELSQDAMICWLSAWSDSRNAILNPALHETGRELIEAMLASHSAKLPDGSLSVEIFRQFHSVDVVVEINEKLILLIEDKVHTSEHSGQLERYVETVKRKKPGTTVYPIFFKTGDQSSYKNADDSGYQCFLRPQLLGVLRAGKARGVASDIYDSYHQHIESIEKDVQSFQTNCPGKWTSAAWSGFFMKVQETFVSGRWSYVPNQSGGFMAFWWGFRHLSGIRVYLQLEKQSLCVKIKVDDLIRRREMREKWYRAIIETGREQGVSFHKPKRFGNGRTMTVAVFESDFRITNDNGTLNYDLTLERLQNAEEVLELTVQRLVNE